MAAPSEIVGARVDDNSSLQKACQNPFATTIIVAIRTHSQNAVGPNQLNDVVLHAALGDSVGIRLDVAQVAGVPDVVRGRAVGLAVRVEVRAGRGAAVGVVAKLVDVHAALGVGIRVLDLVLDHRGGVLVLLREPDGARDAGIAAEDSNCGGGRISDQLAPKGTACPALPRLGRTYRGQAPFPSSPPLHPLRLPPLLSLLFLAIATITTPISVITITITPSLLEAVCRSLRIAQPKKRMVTEGAGKGQTIEHVEGCPTSFSHCFLFYFAFGRGDVSLFG